MSVRVMTAVWALDLPDSEKIVLLALADCANDEGRCWPSMASLSAKCSKGERTVQGAIKSLCDKGHLTRHEVPGKGCNYDVHPRSDCTPAKSAPPQRTTRTPAAAADKPSRTIISSEAKASSPRPWSLPFGTSPQVWTDFLANRKRKRLTNTPTSWKSFLDDLVRVSRQTGIPPPELIEHAAAKGWGGIYDPRDNRHERSDTNPLGTALSNVLGAIEARH